MIMTGDAVGLITNVLRAAITKAEEDAYLHGAWNSRPQIDAEEVAREIEAALGGLSREVSQATRQCSYPGGGGPCEGKNHGRWVSGWTPEEKAQ